MNPLRAAVNRLMSVDDVWGSLNDNENPVTQTTSSRMVALVASGFLAPGEVEREPTWGETSQLRSASGWAAAAGVEIKKRSYIWILRRRETVYLILHLKMGLFPSPGWRLRDAWWCRVWCGASGELMSVVKAPRSAPDPVVPPAVSEEVLPQSFFSSW